MGNTFFRLPKNNEAEKIYRMKILGRSESGGWPSLDDRLSFNLSAELTTTLLPVDSAFSAAADEVTE